MLPAENGAGRDTGILEIIEFEISERAPDGSVVSNRFGINVDKVREVVKTPPIAHAQKDNPALEGVIDLRGDIIPVINLPKWLGLFDPKFKYERTIIVEFNMLRAGLLVNRVNRIHRIPFAELLPPAPLMRGGRQLAATGMVRNEGRIVMMLDMEKLLADIDPETAAEEKELAASPDPGCGVMLVEDSDMAITALKKAFKTAGYSVFTATNGEEALRQLEKVYEEAHAAGRALTDFIRLVVADMEMPLMDGFRLAREIKTDRRFKGVRALIYSSTATPEKAAQWKGSGVDASVGKPDLAELLREANRILS